MAPWGLRTDGAMCKFAGFRVGLVGGWRKGLVGDGLAVEGLKGSGAAPGTPTPSLASTAGGGAR